MAYKFSKILILSMIALVIFSGCDLPFKKGVQTSVLTIDEAKSKSDSFINNYLVTPEQKVTIKNVTEGSCLYSMKLNLADGREVDAFVSKDGKQFFPQVLNVEEVIKEREAAKKAEEEAAAKEKQALQKTAKPKVELFVMSHCPYGTQIEKGILPVVDLLKDKIDFSIKFVYYAMHGEQELKEELNQYCMNKEQTDKYLPYLKCFLDQGDSAKCLTQEKVDGAKLAACVTKTDKEFKVMEQFNDKTKWINGKNPPFDIYKAENTQYGVGGSPTLIVNGKEMKTNRDSKSLLDNICAAFDIQPEECKQPLSSETPSDGFGFQTDSSGGSPASCGN